MSEENALFEDFLMEAGSANFAFINQIHEYLTANGCTIKIQTAKNGYVVSYVHAKTKKVIANYVSRKKGLIMRIYGDNAGKYMAFLQGLPNDMAKAIEKASVCRRLIDPTKCNSRCPMGYSVTLNGREFQKCRYSSFMFLLNDESNPYIKSFLEHELAERNA